MQRRAFSLTLLGASAATLALPAAAQTPAQRGPVEGTHFVRLNQPIATTAGPGKIELLEFFWYGCPHCAAFEPMLDAWAKRLPPDVAFQRVPVAFSAEPYTAHQRIFFALDTLGLVAAMQKKVFYAIHQKQMRLDKPADITAFMAANGVDVAKFNEAYSSFSTDTRRKRANQLADGYKIDGVPALGVHGRFFTSGTLAGDHERALEVAEMLIQRVRKAG